MKNIEFINARARVLRCTTLLGLEVDISFNHSGALSTAAFLDEVDAVIGKGHLFKRSVLLIKAWCTHEAANYCGKGILGSKTVRAEYRYFTSTTSAVTSLFAIAIHREC
jgi:hypothetical protein